MEKKKTRGPNASYKEEEFPWDVRGLFAARVRYWMQELHLSEKEIAERSGGLLTDATVSNCIHNQTEPRLRTIAGWMAALGCSADALIEFPEWMEERKEVQNNPGYTGLNVNAQNLLHKHFHKRGQEVKTGGRRLKNGVNILNGMLEYNGETVLDALWTYVLCADRAKIVIRNCQRKNYEQMSADDHREAESTVDAARKDLEAAQARLMRLINAALTKTAESEGLLEELEEQQAILRSLPADKEKK